MNCSDDVRIRIFAPKARLRDHATPHRMLRDFVMILWYLSLFPFPLSVESLLLTRTHAKYKPWLPCASASKLGLIYPECPVFIPALTRPQLLSTYRHWQGHNYRHWQGHSALRTLGSPVKPHGRSWDRYQFTTLYQNKICNHKPIL